MFPCSACGGLQPAIEDCPECNGAGVEMVRVCPRTVMTGDIMTLIEDAALARQGAWPMPGGTLDQVQSLRDGVRVCWDTEEAWKSKMKIGK